MKGGHIFFLACAVAVSVSAAANDWPSAWETFAATAAKDPKAAVSQTLALEARAAGAADWANAARAIAERFALESRLAPERRDALLSAINDFAEKAPSAIRPALACLLAHAEWDSVRGTDGAADAYAKISLLFDATLDNAEALQSVPAESFGAVFPAGTVPDIYRPTLYDVLAFEQIALCESAAAAGPAVPSFELAADGPAFESATTFTRLIPAEPAPSPILKALQLFKAILQFHDKDKDRSAFAAADLERLAFCFRHAKGNDVRTRYIGALDHFMSEWRRSVISVRAAAIRAELTAEDGDPGIAHLMAERGMAGFPADDIGVRQCKAIIQRLERPALSVRVERVWCRPLPEIHVTYKNIDTLFFRAVPVGFREMFRKGAEMPAALARHLGDASARAWNVPLPPTRDYRERDHAFLVPELPPGTYILFISDDPSFDPEHASLFCQEVQVTPLALVLERCDGVVVQGSVLDARTGKPVDGASVQIWEPRNTDSDLYVCRQTIVTDKTGAFAFSGENKSVRIRATKLREEIWSASECRQGSPSENAEEPQESHLLFADRAVYKPGETVRFAGICALADRVNSSYHTLQGRKPRIALRDPSGKELAAQEMDSNAFGSYSGAFVLPTNSVSGAYTLDAAGLGLSGFNVETRQPAASITLDAPYATPRLDALVTLKGRVTPVSPGISWSVLLGGELIANGKTSTDTNGLFEISFFSKAAKKDAPVLDFEVRAETGTNDVAASRIIRIGRAAWEAAFDCAGWQTAQKPISLRLSLRTHAGEPVAAQGRLRILAVKEPLEIRRPALPGVPPDGIDTWDSAEELTAENISTGTNGLATGTVPLPAGAYRLVFETKDLFGAPVTASQTLLVVVPKAAQMKTKVANYFEVESSRLQPGDTLRALWGTGYADGLAHIEIVQGDRVWLTRWNDSGETAMLVELPVAEAMRGGLTARAVFLRENRLYVSQRHIDIPWDRQALNVTLSPGASNRTWQATATLPGGAPATAEWIACLTCGGPAPNWPASFETLFRHDDSRDVSFTLENPCAPVPLAVRPFRDDKPEWRYRVWRFGAFTAPTKPTAAAARPPAAPLASPSATVFLPNVPSDSEGRAVFPLPAAPGLLTVFAHDTALRSGRAAAEIR